MSVSLQRQSHDWLAQQYLSDSACHQNESCGLRCMSSLVPRRVDGAAAVTPKTLAAICKRWNRRRASCRRGAPSHRYVRIYIG